MSCNIGEIYLTISTLPPKASIAALAFSLIAFILKANFDLSSPVANTFTLSVLLIKPLMYKFSKENSGKASKSAGGNKADALVSVFGNRGNGSPYGICGQSAGRSVQ